MPPIERSIGSFVVELLKIIVLAFVIIIPIRLYVLQPFYVRGASMEPNFEDNQYLIIDELSYRFHHPHRGDVIVLHNPSLPSEFLIKRVIGLPGEHIVIANGKVSVYQPDNGAGGKIDESAYLPKGRSTFGSIDLVLGSDEYYVLGDNRQFSLDSRSFGPVARREIIGRTALRAWPLTVVDVFGRVQVPISTSTTTTTTP